MNKKISRKDFLKNNALTLGGISLGLQGPWNFHSNNFEKNNHIGAKPGEAGSMTRRGSWIQKNKQQTGDIVLVKGGEGCRVVISAKENSAVQQAAKLLAKDIERISGYTPPLVNKTDAHATTIRLVTIGNDEIPAVINTTELKEKWEACKIVTVDNTVWLIGSDFRGTAFAAYILSERLGIDPLYLWTGYAPEFFETLVLKRTDFYSGEPTIKYRGFFHDDEDILPRPFDENDYPYRFGNVSMEWYKRFFETALRLRMNIVAPYTRVRRRYEVQKCASDWGLFYTSHHYDILLSNPFGIERFNLAEKRGLTADWDWFRNKENMLKYWQAGVEENKNLSTIWPVGLRGTDDHAYTFPANISSQDQAKVFGEVLQDQVKIVKDIIAADHSALFHFTLYTEMLDKYENNRDAFNVPENVIIVWPDDNDGIMRSLPREKDKWKHGVYYHLAYYGGDSSKQNVHTVSAKKIAEQFQDIIDSGATEFLLVNVSEMREFIMEARMIAELNWNNSFIPVGEHPAKNYIEWWSKEYFGKNVYKEVSVIYSRYYELMSTPLMTRFGASLFENLINNLYKKFNQKPTDPIGEAEINLLKSRNEKYKSILSLISGASQKMNKEQKQFFFENVELPLLMDFRPTQSSLILLTALSENDKLKAIGLAEKAMKPLEQLELDVLRAERKPFEKWYRETWIRSRSSSLNVHRSYNQLSDFIASGGRISPIKPNEKTGHRIKDAKAWSKFLDEMETLK